MFHIWNQSSFIEITLNNIVRKWQEIIEKHELRLVILLIIGDTRTKYILIRMTRRQNKRHGIMFMTKRSKRSKQWSIEALKHEWARNINWKKIDYSVTGLILSRIAFEILTEPAAIREWVEYELENRHLYGRCNTEVISFTHQKCIRGQTLRWNQIIHWSGNQFICISEFLIDNLLLEISKSEEVWGIDLKNKIDKRKLRLS
jgi:hypothetical protein